MKTENQSIFFYIILGIMLGYAGFLTKSNIYATALAVAGFFVGAFVLENVLGEQKGYKWFFSQGGGWIYFSVWFVAWIVFYNLQNNFAFAVYKSLYRISYNSSACVSMPENRICLAEGRYSFLIEVNPDGSHVCSRLVGRYWNPDKHLYS